MMDTRVEVLKQQLQQALGLELVIGVPDGTAADLFLFPYNLREESHHHNTASSEKIPPNCIDFLLIPTPRFEYATLEKAYRHLQNTPRTETDTCVLEYRRQSLSVADLAQLFLAAHVPLTLCAAYEARFINKT